MRKRISWLLWLSNDLDKERLRLTDKSPSPESQNGRGICVVACDCDHSGMHKRTRSKPVMLVPFLFGISSEPQL